MIPNTSVMFYVISVKTKLITAPVDVNMEYWTDVIFPCTATTDDSTPIDITWFFNDVEIDLDDEA